MWSKLTSFSVSNNGIISDIAGLWLQKRIVPKGTTMTHVWYEAYKAAILETDWTKMQQRLKSADSAIQERQRVLAMDHGGTPEERQAIADALDGMRTLHTEAAAWQNRQSPPDGGITPSA
jgi:hypothetical protein